MDKPDLEERADRLKERIYVSFTALAVVIALGSHGETTAGQALTTLIITVLGTLSAVFVADVLAHMTVHERMLSGTEFRRVLSVSLGAIGVIVLPVGLLLAGVSGLWTDAGAIRGAIIALVVGLVVSAFVAVRKVNLAWWQRIIVLAGLGAIGLAVLFLESLAHG